MKTIEDIKVRLIFAWFDFWVGVFWDKKKKWLYIFPVPMLGLIIKFNSESILSPDRETALEEALKFHKQVAEEAINEQARLLLENEKLRETIKELTKGLAAIQHEINKK